MVQVSIVIPAFERVEPLRMTIQSALKALSDIDGEVIVVDDGSIHPLESQLTEFQAKVRFERQENQGSIIARQTGLSAARGKYLQFLDSDDLLHPAKLSEQLQVMKDDNLDICYCDACSENDNGQVRYRSVSDIAEFALRVQPLPHSPLYRTAYLLEAFRDPFLKPKRSYDAAGDVFLLYNLAPHAARIAHIPKTFAIVGDHQEMRYTQHWEKLGIASILLQQAFLEQCFAVNLASKYRIFLAESAYLSWRKLPRAIPKKFEDAQYKIFERADVGQLKDVGGPVFRLIAFFLGNNAASKVLKWLRPHYQNIRTLPQEDLDILLELL
ncbi:MAG: glycosyltransferase family 2 protein [Bdellovibrionales bacterium]|nr:glycosyltransferase family 2 protein [Bdellovibrionales bacterium]